MRTTYLLPCVCGRKLPVETTKAGAAIRCSCGATLTVPTLREMSRLQPAVTSETATTRRPRLVWSKRQVRILLGALITVTAAGPLVYLEMTRPRVPRIESLAPIAVWSIWQDLRRGTDRHLTPPEQRFLDRLRRYRAGRAVLRVCVGIGLLLMVIFYAIPESSASNRSIPFR